MSIQFFHDKEIDGIIILNTDTNELRIAQLVHTLETEVADEEEEAEEEAPRRSRKKGKKGQKVCKNCGKPGHMAKTCPADQMEEPEGDDEFEVTDAIKEEINDMISEGKGSKEIASYYGLNLKQANHAIAKAKGITLPR